MTILFLLIALVLFLVAMFGATASRFNLVAAGLASLTLALLWPHVAPLFS